MRLFDRMSAVKINKWTPYLPNKEDFCLQRQFRKANSRLVAHQHRKSLLRFRRHCFQSLWICMVWGILRETVRLRQITWEWVSRKRISNSLRTNSASNSPRRSKRDYKLKYLLTIGKRICLSTNIKESLDLQIFKLKKNHKIYLIILNHKFSITSQGITSRFE